MMNDVINDIYEMMEVPPSEEANPLLSAIRAYADCVERKEQIAELEKQNNALLASTRDALVALMTDAEVPKIERGGYTYTLTPKDKYSKRAGSDEQLFEQLRADGLGDLIREAVQPQTLQAAMSSLADEHGGELPSEYDELINHYAYTDISRRRAARKEK
jgi:hypothetical protein